ncbi:unnamed protein product [Coregonus sp. 'balchen']|nr:unnamed protein product [Coregonus sp. 'balchen']
MHKRSWWRSPTCCKSSHTLPLRTAVELMNALSPHFKASSFKPRSNQGHKTISRDTFVIPTSFNESSRNGKA